MPLPFFQRLFIINRFVVFFKTLKILFCPSKMLLNSWWFFYTVKTQNCQEFKSIFKGQNRIYKVFLKKYVPKPSPQSLSPSHRKELGMHRPVEQRKSDELQVGVVQFWFSSELSRQSSSPSQTQVLGMHRWLSQVKSQELGQAWTGGSAEGSELHVFPFPFNFSP